LSSAGALYRWGGLGVTSTSIDMTSARTFVVTVQNGSASATYETKLQAAAIEII
jgi:hypothetical protein